MTATTAYLSDGRHIDVPTQDARDWALEASMLDTTISLADWYTDQGDEHQDELQGKAADDPRCDHLYGAEPTIELARVRVVNASQAGDYDPDRSHASTWVCGARVCVLDALAWVERTTGEAAVWVTNASAAVHTLAPTSDLNEPAELVFPISPENAAEMMDKDGFVSVLISVDKELFLEHVMGTCQELIVEDFVHDKAFSFGSTYNSKAEPVGVDGENFIVKYTTGIAEALAQHKEETA